MVRRAKPVNITTSCGIIIQPTVFNIKTEEYPLSRRMYFYTAGEPKNPLARSLLAFALSPQLQPIIREARLSIRSRQYSRSKTKQRASLRQ